MENYKFIDINKKDVYVLVIIDFDMYKNKKQEW